MQPQQIEGQRAQTILVVDSDESTRRILDLSLRHAGFAVRVASNAEEGDKRLADHPDLVIVAADDPSGLEFCRRAKQGDAMAPAVVLMLDPNVESKRRGLEAGADDFVARPIYVQEVVARSRALLQRRDRERLELSAHDNERFLSTIEDVPLVDLLRAISANQKSGVAVVMVMKKFRDGRFNTHPCAITRVCSCAPSARKIARIRSSAASQSYAVVKPV